MRKAPLPVGVDDFLHLRKKKCFYVDKTLMIQDLIDTGSQVNVFMRPRRFGKSLNISMLQYYFDILHKDDADVFHGLQIDSLGDEYKQHQNQYPVIKMTLKGAEGRDFDTAFSKLKTIIAEEFKRHIYLLEGDTLLISEKEYFQKIIDKVGGYVDFSDSLKLLSVFLEKYYNQKVMILIDEYDVPLEKAHFNGFYEEMIRFIRSFLGDALKTNQSLFKGVLTGCLRVSKESIFTGLNNPDMISILSTHYDEYFGFTEAEVTKMFRYYHFEEQLVDAKNWYNGYLFGKATVYNPWSLIKYVKDVQGDMLYPKSYWSNTSSNSIVKDLIEIANDDVKGEIEHLINDGTIIKSITEDIVYSDIKKNMDNLWSFLFLTGYLTKVSETFLNDRMYYQLSIPNKEVKYIYERQIREWFEERITNKDNLTVLHNAMLDGDVSTLESEMITILGQSISYLDSQEAFYHGLLSGLFASLPGYRVVSNREAGKGRVDLFLKPVSMRKQAFIIELKVAKHFNKLENEASIALKQIEDRNYEAELLAEGYQDIGKYGISFYRKDCLVMKDH